MNINLQYILTFFALIMPQRIRKRIWHLWEETQIASLSDKLRSTIFLS